MVYHLVATFAAALGVAGLIYGAFRILGRRPPKFLIPVAAGIAMLGYNIWSEYAWYGRTVAALPKQVAVIDALTYQAPWQPWTYFLPRINRLIAVDVSQLKRNSRAPGYVWADVILMERHEPTKTLVQLFDCANARVADVNPGMEFDQRGLPIGAAWSPVRADNRLYRKVCASP